MRRNTVRLLKYLVFASVFVIAGPYTLRYLFGSNNSNDVDQDDLVPHMAQGLPESPDVVKRNQGLHEDRQVQVNVLNLIVISLMMHVNVIGISPAIVLFPVTAVQSKSGTYASLHLPGETGCFLVGGMVHGFKQKWGVVEGGSPWILKKGN